MSNQMTFEEMEAQLKATETPAPPKPEDVKLPDIEGLPEHLRGKSAPEIAKYIEGLQSSLKLSEAQRLATEANARSSASAAPVEPVDESNKPLTRDELKELYERDPIEAMLYMQQASAAALSSHIENRLKPLAESTVGQAEAEARRLFATEFELFGDEIKQIVSTVPNRAALGTTEGWRDLISYVRGRPGNFERYIDEHAKKTRTPSEARSAEIANVGFTPAPIASPSGPSRITKLDSVQQEIARNLGMSDEDYIKWNNIGA